MSEENNHEWEQELKERVSALLTQRVTPLHSELEKLEKTIAELRTSAAPDNAAYEQDAGSIAATVKQLIDESNAASEKRYEEQLAEELEKARAEITINVRQTLEADFERRLAQATTEAQNEAQAQLQSQLAAAAASTAVAAGSAETPAPAGTDYVTFKAAIEEINAQRTQSETLTTLISGAAKFAPRVVFFVVKGGDAVGWKTVGFTNGLNDETVRSLAVSTQTPSMLMQSLISQNTAVALTPPQEEISLILGKYGDVLPRGAVAIPLVVRGKAAAVLYADSADLSDDSIQLEAIESLVQVASMGIELLPVRRNAEPARPATAPVQAPAAPAVAPAQEAPKAETPAAPEIAPAAVTFDSPSMRISPNPAFAESELPSQPAETVAETPVSTTAELTPPVETVSEAPAQETVAEPEPATAAQEPEPEEIPRSIFEQVKAEVEIEPEPEPTPVAPAPEVAPAPVVESFTAAPPDNTDAPTWMRRLESTEPETPQAQPAPAPEPPLSTSMPLPATPPPMQRPSLANWGARERLSGDLSATQPMPFQTDSPSLKPSEGVPNFNQPSDPPRYAAPSLSVSTAASETEVRAHNDARRFARLLVSEIKLYNAAKVNEGRRNADLYSRLRDEIDRSRKVYDKRVSPTVAAKFDYFYDELVQTLAEGDPTKLGESCPGPMVVTS